MSLTAIYSGHVLTAWDDDPNKVHEEVIPPEVVRFWSAVCKAFVIVIEHTRSVIEDVAINLTKRDQGLQRVTERMVVSNHQCNSERQGTPADLMYTVLA